MPPSKGANMMRLMAAPRSSGGKRSPTMAGLRTLEATAMPVRARAAMSCGTERARAASRVERAKSAPAALTMAYRPATSESGPMRSGPAASPNSQMVTRSTGVELVVAGASARSLTMCRATGITAMQLAVLGCSARETRSLGGRLTR